MNFDVRHKASPIKRADRRIRNLIGHYLGFNAAIDGLKADIASLQAEHARWRELAPLAQPLLAMTPDERRTILSGALGLYEIGKRNAPDRDTWVATTLTDLPAGLRLLDAGAGECQYKRHCAHLKYVAQDVAVYDATSDVGLQNPGWSFNQVDIISDIVDIPEPDASFDVVLCTEVLEHLPDPVRALDEMARLLKPGGMMIVTAPFWSLTHQAPFHFATGFNRFFYEHHFARLGFDVVELTPNGSFFECLAQEVRRVPSMMERFTGARPDQLDLIGMQIVLRMAWRMAQEDTGTSEMLSYGLHVRARKAQQAS